MLIPELSAKSEKKRTALYMDVEMYEEIEAFATEQKVSVNRAALYLIDQALDSLTESQA